MDLKMIAHLILFLIVGGFIALALILLISRAISNKKASDKYKEFLWKEHVKNRTDGKYRVSNTNINSVDGKKYISKVAISYKEAKAMKVVPKEILKQKNNIGIKTNSNGDQSVVNLTMFDIGSGSSDGGDSSCGSSCGGGCGGSS